MSVKGDVMKRLTDGPRCPKCNAKIDYLKNYESVEMYPWLSLQDGDERWEQQEFQPSGKGNEFECPECSEVLFTDVIKALKFLNGEL